MTIVPIKSLVVLEQADITAGDKTLLRQELLTRRAALSATQQRKRAQHVTQVLYEWLTQNVAADATVALYSAFRGEVDVFDLVDVWCAQGGRVCLPVVRGKGAPLVFFPYLGKRFLHRGAYGILEPMHSVEVALNEIQVLLMPCVGFTAGGYRLGYGGGYYDRTLAQGGVLPTLIGVADAWAQVDFAPDKNDVVMDYICLTGCA